MRLIDVLCAQRMRDLFAIAKFLFVFQLDFVLQREVAFILSPIHLFLQQEKQFVLTNGHVKMWSSVHFTITANSAITVASAHDGEELLYVCWLFLLQHWIYDHTALRSRAHIFVRIVSNSCKNCSGSACIGSVVLQAASSAYKRSSVLLVIVSSESESSRMLVSWLWLAVPCRHVSHHLWAYISLHLERVLIRSYLHQINL